ncbi:MAG: PEP-CTERM sorting domain-containing protein [Planctomycetota bacterium]|nr:PEP-CTERM sorting domain-containing protein [Planctomycetota bacterium]
MLTSRSIIVCALLMVFSYGAQGAVVSFDLSVEFSGATPPAGAEPWLNATFDDEGSAGSVTLTLTTTPTPTTGLTGTESVSEWMFNLDPSLNPTELIFSSPTKTGSFDNPVINTGVDAFKANGAGYFDIEFAFIIGGGPSTRFGAGDVIEYAITGIDSLTAESFNFLCTSAEHGPFPTSAHVQSIGDEEDSGWVTVPEPATLSLLVLGGLGILKRRRRR